MRLVPSRRFRILLLGAACAGSIAAPAIAEEPVETAIRHWVSTLDASPNWVAGFDELTVDPDQRSATIRGLSIRSETLATKLEITFGTIGVVGYAETPDGGFNADEVKSDQGKVVFGDVATFKIGDILLERLGVPSFADYAFDPNRAFTSMVKAYATGAKTTLDRGHIGRIDLEQTIEGQVSRTSYGSYDLKGLANGMVDEVSAGPFASEMPSPDGLVKMWADRLEARKLDLGALVHVFDPDAYQGGVGDGVWRPVLALEQVRNFRFEFPGASVRMGGLEIENVKLRQPKTSLAPFFDALLADPTPSDEEMTRLVKDHLAGLLSFYGVGAMRMSDLDVVAPGLDRFHLGDFHINELSADGIGEIGVADLDLAVQDQGSAGAERLAIGGFKFPSAELLAAAIEASETGATPDPMPLVPTLGFVEIVNLDVSKPDKKVGSVDRARLDLTNYIGPVPTAVALDVRGLDLDLTQIDDRQAREMLKGLGYERLNADYGFKVAWREADESVTIDGFKLAMKDLGTLTADAVLTGLKRSAIEQPQTLADALPSLMFARGRLSFQDQSVVGRAIDMQAKKMNVEPDKFRDQIASALPLFLKVLKNPGFQGKLAPALKAFIKAPGTLTFIAEPMTPVPVVSIIDAAEHTPQQLPDLLSVEVKSAQ